MLNIVEKVRDALQGTFLKSAVEANEETGAIKRRRKFTPSTLAQAFILAFLQNPKANHSDIAAVAADSGVDVSPQAVEQRYSLSLAAFFKALFEKMAKQIVGSEDSLAPILCRFTEVNVIDSSIIALPDSQKAEFRGCGGSYDANQSAIKLQTEFNLRDGSLRCVELEQGRATDGATERQHVTQSPGSLRIADLGYFNVQVLREIDDAGAFFLSRVTHTTVIYVEGIKQNLVTWLNATGRGTVDQAIELGASDRLKCRLIAWRVPEEIANARRRKIRAASMRKHRREPSKEALAACDWEFLVTNIGEEQLSVKEAIVLYRTRWQIELLFKRWKTYGRIAEMDGVNDIVKMTRFWARLCAALIQHWLTVAATWSSELRISLAKSAKLARQIASDMATLLSFGGDWISFLQRFTRRARAGCRLTTRRTAPGNLQLLRNPELLEYSLT